MDPGPFGAVIWVAVLAVLIVMAARRSRSRRRGRAGPGAAGAVYDLLNEDRRRAVEIVVEERAAARDPEDKDGNLPELQDPRR